MKILYYDLICYIFWNIIVNGVLCHFGGDKVKKVAILDEIASGTNGKSYKTYKYCFDGVDVPRMDYDDHKQQFTWKDHGETEYHDKPISLKQYADRIIVAQPPLFRFFLDGSRKTYKVDDMAYTNRVYPIIAGQVGIGCCERVNGYMFPLRSHERIMFWRDLVIALPKKAKSNDWVDDKVAFELLRKKINENPELISRQLEFASIIPYSTKVEVGDKIENKGIAVIQDYMVEREKAMVAELVRLGFLMPNQYLLKDGSLEYQVHKIGSKRELERFRNNYQFVVGVSKSFNPEYCIDKNGRNNSDLIANLELFSRTPVSKYYSDRIGNIYFAVWFVRIRERRVTDNPFDGILKIEKILINDEQEQNGLDSEEVDLITANIINERNPVCYGADRRWANHLYPVYVTESFLKSKYLGESMFLNLF